jgi:hypothetical protein
MTSLVDLDEATSYTYSHSLNSTGIKKSIPDGVFPYSIFAPCKNTIRKVSRLFADVQYNQDLGEVELPGTMFLTTPNIQRISGFFMNFPNNFRLSSEGFKNCVNLQDVASLFANDSGSLNSPMVGSIPSKFFFQGYLSDKTYTYKYLNPDYPIDPTTPIEQEDGTTVYPTIPDSQIKTLTFTVKQPRANIIGIEECFKGCTIENNPDYKPFKYYLLNGVWFKADENYAQYTYAWEFDGVSHPEDYENNPQLYQSYDDSFDTNVFTSKSYKDMAINCNLNFNTPPDLLRYCGSGITSLKGLFRDTYKAYYTAATQTVDYVTICPYLMKPVPNIITISYMFYGCFLISGYTDSGNYFLIPRSFFKYTANLQTLSYSFANNIFPSSISLDVFADGANKKKSLDVSYMFFYPLFNSTALMRVYIGPIFKGIMAQKLKAAFAITDSNSYDETMIGAANSEQYVTFDTVFDKDKFAADEDIAVFCGYNKDCVEFKNPVLRTTIDAYNYRYGDGTYPAFSS